MIKITLKGARANAGMTQGFVAKTLGVSVSTIKSWEKGITFPNQPQIEMLCNLYQVPYDGINFLPKKLTLS
jgi:transcriptional regulator with XRE-family HTH domain